MSRIDSIQMRPSVDDGVAVGVAGVVDPAGVVPVDRCVDHHVVVDGEEEGVVPLAGDVGVARLGLGRASGARRRTR
jgi:hypothetical protein